MRKVLSFSVFLIIGLFLSQFLPVLAGSGYGAVKAVANMAYFYIASVFIIINVGREFEVDKSRWKSYTERLFYSSICICHLVAPVLLCLLASRFWNSWEAWKRTYY